MPQDRRRLARADLPDELTPETIGRLPITTLRRLARPGNGVLDAEEQTAFDAALHEVMSATAGRVSQQLGQTDWARVMREAQKREGRRGGPGRSVRADAQLRRIAERIGQQVDLAEGLAPGVDWSFAQPAEKPPADDPGESDAAEATEESTEEATEEAESDGSGTVSDLEQDLTDQVELVQVMSEIADISKRTYELEQQRDLQETRTVFFGFVVSVAVLVAGWAPLVAADDWAERLWVVGLTLATCVLAGVVYALVRRWQNDHQPAADEDS